MKTFLVLVAAIGLTLPTTVNAQSSEEQILGAIAGGYLGSTIGQGDGRKAATVIGAIIGYRMGEQILNSKDRRRFMSMSREDFYEYCSYEVPYRYSHRRNTHDMWVRGCVERLHRQQRELEREAYEDGYYGSSN